MIVAVAVQESPAAATGAGVFEGLEQPCARRMINIPGIHHFDTAKTALLIKSTVPGQNSLRPGKD
jgi:hypothetical protein